LHLNGRGDDNGQLYSGSARGIDRSDAGIAN
jgi:hypothetical protein